MTGSHVRTAKIEAAVGIGGDVVEGIAGKVIRVLGGVFSSTGGYSLILMSATTPIATLHGTVGGPMVIDPMGMCECVAGESLTCEAATTMVHGFVWYEVVG